MEAQVVQPVVVAQRPVHAPALAQDILHAPVPITPARAAITAVQKEDDKKSASKTDEKKAQSEVAKSDRPSHRFTIIKAE